MEKLIREIYGAGILFFYYFKWPMILGYPALVYGLDYPRWWVADLLWLYCVVLALKDIVWKFFFKKSYCEEAACRHSTLQKERKQEERSE
jgi:hypothetical protein